jgi:hypothetical protein
MRVLHYTTIRQLFGIHGMARCLNETIDVFKSTFSKYIQINANTYRKKRNVYKEPYYFYDLLPLSMYALSSNTLTQYENTKVTLSFLSSQYLVSIKKEKFEGFADRGMHDILS